MTIRALLLAGVSLAALGLVLREILGDDDELARRYRENEGSEA